MNRRIAAMAASIALIISFVVPSTVSIAAAKHAGTFSRPAATMPPAPKDPYAKQDRKWKGTTITYFGGSVGTDHDTDVALGKAFKKSTGITVKFVERNGSDSQANITKLQNMFNAHSTSLDATGLDVVWTGIFGKYLAPLKSFMGPLVKLEAPNLIKNDTIGGKLIAMPYQGDFGLLYYRKDLLRKYHLKVPTKWTQLASEAKKIQNGERKKNKSFYGFVFQGSAYEGLTCDSLEWIASYGGGNFINNKGKVTVDNPKARAALTEARSWIKNGITPPDIAATYNETFTENSFLGGNSAFARNWPYMWADQYTKGKALVGKIGVAPLPAGSAKSSAAVGGWQVGVNKYTTGKVKGASLAWARYYASVPVEVYRAVHSGIAPTMPSVAKLPKVKKANAALGVAAKTTVVARPAAVLGTNYGTGSGYIYQDINLILTGSTSVSSGLSRLKSQLQSLHP
jgi:trehalose/maltose transport system substrate-binding protein